MRGIQRSRIPWLALTIFCCVAWSVLAQETPPQTSQAAATPTMTDTIISWREVILVFFLILIFFAGLIGYEWVRKRA